MKKGPLILASIILVALACYCISYAKKHYQLKHQIDNAKNEVHQLSNKGDLKDGDIIFQTSLSKQSMAIQLATKSKYSHCGLIFKINGEYEVFEAVQPVKYTPLYKWIARGQNGQFVIKRLKKDSILTAANLFKMKQLAGKFSGKSYDLNFEWSDDRIYCSELIWKIYQRALGVEVGKLQKLSEFDLTNDAVKTKMKERYGEHIPANETVISPAAIFASPTLITVSQN
jgi:uncharacterized protein YycO